MTPMGSIHFVFGSLATMLVGWWLIRHRLQASIESAPAAMRGERQALAAD